MRKLLILLLFVTAINAEFLMEKVEVSVSDIQSDGSAHVHESIKFIMYGEYENSLYDSAISNNKLSYWSNITKLKDVKMHIDPSVVDVQDFRLRPQPRTKCNPIQETCHGELIIDYWAYPTYENETIKPETSLFDVEMYKPRTVRYTLNPKALSFTKTSENNILLEDKVYLVINLPAESVLLDINPQPTGEEIDLPTHVDSLSWEDIVLVKFSLVFDVEESIDKEVTDFFSNIARNIANMLSSEHGLPLVILLSLGIGSYLYIVMAKRRGED